MPVLQSVTDVTGLTTRLVVPDGPYAVVAAGRRAGQRPVCQLPRQARVPALHVGRKALLATLPPEQARALALEAGMPVRTERTITDPDALLRDLELSAARGYTIDDEEDSEGGCSA